MSTKCSVCYCSVGLLPTRGESKKRWRTVYWRRSKEVADQGHETLGGKPVCVECWKDPFGRAKIGKKRAVIDCFSRWK